MSFHPNCISQFYLRVPSQGLMPMMKLWKQKEMASQDSHSCHGWASIQQSKGTGRPPLPFTEELPTEWSFLFQEAKLTSAKHDEICSREAPRMQVLPLPLLGHVTSFFSALPHVLIEMLLQHDWQPQICVWRLKKWAWGWISLGSILALLLASFVKVVKLFLNLPKPHISLLIGLSWRWRDSIWKSS